MMRIHHLNCGVLRPLGGGLVDGRPGLLRAATLVCHCLLLETDDRLVLVDTGMGTPAVEDAKAWLGTPFVALTRPGRDPAMTAVEQVAALGFDPADVRDVVLTHLDLDHAGGLVDFPQARVHVYADELRAMQDPQTASERRRYRKNQFAHGPRWTTYGEAGERWFGFDAVRPLEGISEDVLLVPLAGHTRGHAGVAVDTGDGWLLHAGDAYFHHGQMAPSPRMPFGLGVFERLVQTVKEARLDNQRRLRMLANDAEAGVAVFAAHDRDDFERLSSGGAVDAADRLDVRGDVEH